MQEESIDEILDGQTETFDRSEKRSFAEKVEKAAINAKTKLSKYFDNSVGVYSSLKLMKDLQIFNPNDSLAFDEKPALSVPDFDKVPSTEFNLYRLVSRSFTPISDICDIHDD